MNRRTESEYPELEDLPLFLTADEVAALLRTTRMAVYKKAADGKLPGVHRDGRRLLFRRDRLVEWLRGTEVPSPGDER